MGRNKFSEKIKKEVFFSLPKLEGEDSQYRCDFEGKKIHFTHYGKRDSNFGWNIDHIDGDRKNSAIQNLRALSFETHEKINYKNNKNNLK